MNASRRVSLLFCAFLVVLFATQHAAAQCVSLNTLASAYGQDFDALSNTAGSTTNDLPPAVPGTLLGWDLIESGLGARDNDQYAVDTGGSNTGDTFSYGAAGNTERALGGLQSGTLIPVIGACFTNNTGATLTSLDVNYFGEQWRIGNIGTARDDRIDFQYSTNATSLTTGTWLDVNALDFTNLVKTNATATNLNGNLAANRTNLIATIGSLTIANGATFWIRWNDLNASGADDGLAVDDFFLTPQGAVVNNPIVPTCATPVTTTAGTATTQGVSATDADGTVTSATITGITPSNPGTITLTGFTPAGAVGGTANATLDVSAATPAGTYSVTIQWANNDGTPQTANCVVSVVVNAPPTVVFIHDVQGSGAATPIPGSTVTIQGVVIGDFQPIPNDNRLSGFFVQEEDTDANAEGNPATSEGIFVFCSACPTNVAEGQIVQVTGTVSEFFNNTQITASTAGSVVITNAGNNLGLVTPATIDLPVVTPSIDDYYEPRENMLVNYVDTLTVSEYFEQARYGRIELYEGGRPYGYTEDNAPSVAGYAAHLDNLSRRRVYIDDDDNAENSVLNLPNGQQFVFHPQANGGLSVGTQGTDFFRGGDLVNSLTGILHWSFSGGSSPNEWRVRPAAATPAAFTVANPRPATPPAVGGAIRAASVNVLNYFTTLNQRGADSPAELNRQRERTSIVLCDLDADVVALMEIENHPTDVTITDLRDAVNARCGGTQPYEFVATAGGDLGTDEIRVMLMYRTGVLAPVGAPHVDMDPVHNRPPTAQTFDVVDPLNPATGQRFTVLANHSKSKGSCPASGPDADQNDGQGCWAPTRVAQHNRLLTWVNGTVIPAAGDPDMLMLGDFNSNGSETPTTTLTSGGFTDLEVLFDPNTYSYVFDGQIGHLDYAFSNATLTPQITGAAPWHINADENPLFDYNDEIDDGAAEQAFEEKPDGSALVPPRVLFQPGSRYRASDHDPVLVGIFAISDLIVTKADSPDPVTAGNNLTYTITVTNNGPDSAPNASWSDNLTDSTFVSLSTVAGWSCTTPAVGATGMISCTNPSFGVGSAVFTLTTNVSALTAAGTELSNTASVMSTAAEGNPGDENDTETTTVATSADLSVTKADSPDPVDAGSNITYTITVNNAGPSAASTVELTDTVPTNTTFVSLANPGGWSCTTPAVGATGNISCTTATAGLGDHVFTLVVAVDPTATTNINNSATVTSTTSDPNSGNETGNSETTVNTSADLSVTKADSPDPVNAGANITYTITVNNAGPSNASTVELTDTVPTNTTFVSLASPGGWSCTTPAVGATGNISCTNASAGLGNHVFTLVVNVDPSTAGGASISNSATVTSTTSDPNGGNETGNSETTVGTSADLSVTKSDSPDPVNAGANLTYTITVNNAGPSNASTVTLTDVLPAETLFFSLASPAGWMCTTPGVFTNGTVTCTAATVGVGDHVFTLVVNVLAATTSGTVINNSATVMTNATADPNSGNETGSSATTVATSANMSLTKTDSPDPVNAGNNITYAITVTNAGPSNADSVTLSDTLPAGTTFVSFTNPLGWTCSTPAVGATGTVSCSKDSQQVAGTATPFTLVVKVDPTVAAGTVISNSITVASTTPDPTSGNETATTTTTVATSADLQISKGDSPDPVNAGANITYQMNLINNGPSSAATATFSDPLPAGTTFVSLSTTGPWTCTTPAVGATGTVSCSNASFGVTTDFFTLVVAVDPSTAAGTILSNTATLDSATSDPASGNDSATTTTTVAVSADLSVTKVDTPDPVTAGTNLTYTITLNNAGPSNASTVTLNDTVPANTTFVSLSAPAGWSCTTPAVGGTGNVSCSNAVLAPGNAVFTLVVNVGAAVADGTIITNTATAASPTDSNNLNDSGTATTTVGTGAADLSVTKTDSPDPVTPGNNLTYTITVNNAGPSNATSVTLTDAVPGSTSFVSFAAPAGWLCTTPAVGNSGTISCSIPTMITGNAVFTLVVQTATAFSPGALPISNTVTVASATTDPNPGNESATATTTPGPQVADVSVTKTDSPDPVTPGANLTYTISLTNAGPSGADNFAFTDTLPAGTSLVSLTGTGPGMNCLWLTGATSFTCYGTSLPPVPPGTYVFTAVVAVDPSVTPGTVLTNTVVTSTNTFDPDTSNDDTTTTTLVGPTSASLSVTKTDSPDPVAPGSNLTYTITVNNAGPSNASTVSLTDNVPANTTFVSLSAPAGWSCATPAVGATGLITCTNASLGLGDAVFTLTVNVDSGVAGGTILSNTATVASATADPNTGNESATATTTVGSDSADLSVSKTDTPDPVTPGTNLTYTITVNNAGPSSAISATLSDTVPANTTFVSFTAPAGWTCTTPAVGGMGAISCSNATMTVGSAVFTLVVNVTAGVPGGTILSNTATAASATTDPNAANDSDTETTTAGSGSADLSVTKTDSPDPVPASVDLTYTITVNNAGPSNAATVSLSDTVPANTTFVSLAAPGGWSCATPAVGGTGTITCTIASMSVGSNMFTLVVNVDPGVAGGTILSNTAAVTSATADPATGNESDTETTTVSIPSADLSLTKTDSPDPVSPGTNLTYIISLTNTGPSNASTVTIADTVPANTTFVSIAPPPGWSCTTPAVGGTGAISCSNANVGLGAVFFGLVVNVDASASDGSVITNTATVTSATADPVPGDESATATTTVDVSNADLSLTKTDDADPVMAGANLTYTLTVNNAGPDAATSVTLNDTLPTETTFVSIATPAGWTCTTPAVGATGAVSCSNASMAAGSAVFTLVVNVSSTTPGGSLVTNTATVASATFDPAAGNESDTETTNVISPATVTGTKSASGTFTPGSTVTYTIVLSNAGPAAQSDNPGNELTDVLPTQLTLVSANATTGTAVATVATNTVTWNGSIPAGGSVTITIQAIIEADVPVGTTVSNQGTISFDADGNGTNEGSAFTGGAPTNFIVAAPTGIGEVPALDGFGLAILAAMLAALGLVVMRRT